MIQLNQLHLFEIRNESKVEIVQIQIDPSIERLNCLWFKVSLKNSTLMIQLETSEKTCQLVLFNMNDKESRKELALEMNKEEISEIIWNESEIVVIHGKNALITAIKNNI